MATRIQPKRSTTPNSKPQVADLRSNEIALNIPDRKLFINNNGTVEELLNGAPNDETIITSMFVQSITDGVGNTWFVSKNGTDKAQVGGNNPLNTAAQNTNQWGATEGTAFATIKYAMTYAQSGDVINVSAGEYEEIFPLEIPAGVAVRGSGQKNTFIKPTTGTNQLDAFLMIGDCMIEDLTIKDYFYNSSNDTGYAFKLKTSYNVATEGRRPYIKGVSVITKGSVTSASDPRGFNQGDAGRGALIDGAVVSTASSEATLLFNECTFIVPNSRGLYLKNGARAEWLNSFTYFAQDSIVGENTGGTGFAGQGKIRLKLNGVTGTFNVGNVITLRNSGGTIIAQGTISGNDGTYITIDGQGSGEFVEAAASTDGKTITVNGDAQLSTTEKKFGTASILFDGTGDNLALATSSDFGFGTGDFAVETFIRPTAITVLDTVFDFRTANPEVALLISINSSGGIEVNVNGSNVITGGTLTINTWAHIAVSRVSGTTSLFVNGSRVGSAYTDSNDYGNTKPLRIGSAFDGGNAFAGYIDEIRISKGAARYANAASITVPTAAFTPDVNTSLLVHADGLSGSTEILDGGITSQDIQSSTGGTAQFITLADYTDFGAELRSIGSASVYGTRGITADGKGVRLRCIVHNFGYVGLGADQSNDISNVLQANEVIEQNSGRALFTSMDQNGDFRVGNAFFVDQERGTVSFAGGDSGGTTFDQLTVSGSGNTTTILPTSITVGNLGFSGSQIINNTSNGIELGSILELQDGSSPDPSLTFINDNNSGIFRDTDYVETSGGSPLTFGFNDSRKLQIGDENNSLVNFGVSESNIGSLTIVANGSNYAPGQYATPTTGGAGTGATLNVEIPPFTVNITNKGSGFQPAALQQEDIQNTSGNGTGGVINITTYGIEEGQIAAGSGYYGPYEYSAVPLAGGNGTNASANINVSAGGNVTDITIISHGDGYNNGDVLTVLNSDMTYIDPTTQNQLTSGGAGFSWTLNEQPGSVKSAVPQYVPTWGGFGYRIGDVISCTDTVGSGTNFSATVNAVGVPESIAIGNTGNGYNVTDRLEPTFSIDTTVPIQGTPWVATIDGIFGYIDYDIKVLPATDPTLGNSYYIDKRDGNGFVEHPDITFERGYVYSFIFTDSGAGTHPVHLSTTEDGTHGGGTRYTTNVRNYYDGNGVLNGYQYVITDVTPTTLYYYCEIHPNMAGASGNRATITTGGTFGSGIVADVATLNRAQNILLNTDGTATYQGNLTTPSQTCTGTITTLNLVAQKTGGGTGGDITAQGNLLVNGNATVDGDLLIKGTSEFSATVGGAGEVSIGDVDADTVNIKGDILFNPTYAAPTPPATVGPLTATQFILDQSEAKFGFFEFEPKSEVDITGRLHNTGDAFLASTQNETLHVGRDQETYTSPANIVLDVNGNASINGYVETVSGSDTSPSFRFSTSSVTGLYSHNDGSSFGVSFTNESGNILQVNKGEVKFYRNAEFIATSLDQTTVFGGSGYTLGQYSSVALTGGSGDGFIGAVTVAFDTTITTAGAGYTDAEYVNVNLTSISNAPSGALQTINIISGGSDYVTGTYTNVPVVGGSGSSGTVDVTVSGGGISQIVPNVVGSGYSAGESISVSTSDIGGSQLTGISINNGGTGYSDGTYIGIPLVNTSGSGTNATASFTVSGGAVTVANVETNGGGYTVNDTFTVAADDITVSTLTGVTISGAGTNYTNGTYTGVATTMTNTRDGNQGAGATLDITVTGNQATGVVVNGAGTNYQVGDTLEVSVTDVGGGAAGVLGTVTIPAVNVAVTVGVDTVNSQANGVFYLNGVESPSNFPLLKGVTYIFDQSNSTNSSYNSQAHPLMFSTGDDGDHNGNGHYLDGVTYKLDGAVVNMAGYVSGFAAATTSTAEFAVPSTAPSTLYYWCHSHTNQGDSIAVNSFSDGTTTGVNLTGGSGSSAQATVEVVGGIVTTITITDGGLGYSTTDTNLGLTGFTNLVLATGTLTNPTGMEFTVSSISLGSGLVLDATAVLTGASSQLQVGNVGTGSGGASGQATLTVNNGAVISVVITDGGSGFSIGDTIRVNDVDMLYTDAGGAQLTSAVPTTQMVLTITQVGTVTVVTAVDNGEGYKANDVLTTSNANLGGTGSGFTLTVNSVITESTIQIDEKLGSITLKQLDATTFTIDNSLTLTGTGINKTTAGNFVLGTTTNNYVQIGGTQAFIVPVGNTAARPAGVSGMMRFNSENLQFEGHNGISFVSLGGVRDVDLDTFISAELNTADDDDTFRFFNAAVNTIILDKDKYILNNVDEIDYTDLNGITLWVEGTAVVSPYAATTFDGSSSSVVDVNAETITLPSHNLTQGVIVTYLGVGGDIGGLTSSQDYHVEVVDANTIKLAANAVDLANDNFINFLSLGGASGQTLTPDPSTVVDILYYYGDNVYAITGTGTFDASAANFPTHTTGEVANGTAQLTWRRTRFSSPVFSGKDINNIVETFGINTGSLRFSSTASNAIINSNKNSLDFGFDNTGDKVLFGATKTGGIFVNTGYAAGTTSNTEILDYELKEFTLKDTKVLTVEATLDTSVGNSTSLGFKPYTEGYSGKFMVEIKDNSTTPKRQFSEISFLCTSDGASIIFTEVSKIYTDVVLCDVSVDIVANNITLLVQDSQSSSTVVYTVKAIHNSILA